MSQSDPNSPGQRLLEPVGGSEPFFIVGCGRSGTTLLQTLLDAHPRISIPPESHIFIRFWPFLDMYGDLTERKNLRRFVNDLVGDARIRQWGLRISPEAFCESLHDRSVRGVVSQLFTLFAQSEGKVRWGDKTPAHMSSLRQIKAVFPEAKIVCLIRDGRDVAASLLRAQFAANRIDGAARTWRKYIFEFEEAKRWLPPQDVCELRYEALVRDPQAAMDRLCAFLGEQPTTVSREVPKTARRQQYIQRAAHFSTLRGPISEQHVGKFSSQLSRREVEIFETVARDALVLLGYPLLTPANVRLTRWERARLFMTDHARRVRRKLTNREVLLANLQLRMRGIRRMIRCHAAHPGPLRVQ